MTHILAYALPGPHHRALASALGETAALAGWQALDLGHPDRAWTLHATAKAAALEGDDPGVLAHVLAQQAFTPLDIDRAIDAALLVQQAGAAAGSRIPTSLRAWLWAAEAEANAAAGLQGESRLPLDQAQALIDKGQIGELPYVVLDATHLQRWRGHCLARLGAPDAVDELEPALKAIDQSFVRAKLACIATWRWLTPPTVSKTPLVNTLDGPLSLRQPPCQFVSSEESSNWRRRRRRGSSAPAR